MYHGTDYLPFALNNWLCESSSPGSLRENYVLLRGNNLIGFASVYFQNNRNTAVRFARRIKRELRGRGYGKILEQLLQETLTTKYPHLGSVISVIGVFGDQGKTRNLVSPKFGNLLTVKEILVYKFRCNQLISPPAEGGKTRLVELSRDQFAEALRAGPDWSTQSPSSCWHQLTFIP